MSIKHQPYLPTLKRVRLLVVQPKLREKCREKLRTFQPSCSIIWWFNQSLRQVNIESGFNFCLNNITNNWAVSKRLYTQLKRKKKKKTYASSVWTFGIMNNIIFIIVIIVLTTDSNNSSTGAIKSVCMFVPSGKNTPPHLKEKPAGVEELMRGEGV